MIAPDSNTGSGAPPAAGAWSTIAGMRLFGEMARNSGLNCSPLPMSTGTTRCGRPVSSMNTRTFWPLGVGQ